MPCHSPSLCLRAYWLRLFVDGTQTVRLRTGELGPTCFEHLSPISFGMLIEIRRVYDDNPDTAGYRVLVDRIWPRGVSKASLELNEWCRDVAPSHELRKWFGHDPQKWNEFRRRYREELADHDDDLERLREIAKDETLILLYSARDVEQNQARALLEILIDSSDA